MSWYPKKLSALPPCHLKSYVTLQRLYVFLPHGVSLFYIIFPTVPFFPLHPCCSWPHCILFFLASFLPYLHVNCLPFFRFCFLFCPTLHKVSLDISRNHNYCNNSLHICLITLTSCFSVSLFFSLPLLELVLEITILFFPT